MANNIRKRTYAGAALILAAGLGLAGCSSDGGSNEPAGQNENQTPEVLTEENFVERISAAQLEAETAHLTMTMSVEGEEMVTEADMVLAEDPAQMAMQMSMEVPGAGAVEMRMVDAKMYMSMGEMTEGKFVELDSADAGMGDLDEIFEQADPQAQLEAFDAALQDFSVEENAEEIDGVQTHKYTLVLDTQTLLENQDMSGVPEGSLEDTIEYEMYVGPDDLPRRMVMDVAGTETVSDFSAWGESVNIEAPAADEIIDGAQLGL